MPVVCTYRNIFTGDDFTQCVDGDECPTQPGLVAVRKQRHDAVCEDQEPHAEGAYPGVWKNCLEAGLGRALGVGFHSDGPLIVFGLVADTSTIAAPGALRLAQKFHLGRDWSDWQPLPSVVLPSYVTEANSIGPARWNTFDPNARIRVRRNLSGNLEVIALGRILRRTGGDTVLDTLAEFVTERIEQDANVWQTPWKTLWPMEGVDVAPMPPFGFDVLRDDHAERLESVTSGPALEARWQWHQPSTIDTAASFLWRDSDHAGLPDPPDGVSVAGQPSLVADADGRIHLFIRAQGARQGGLWHLAQNDDGRWSGDRWEWLGQPPADAPRALAVWPMLLGPIAGSPRHPPAVWTLIALVGILALAWTIQGVLTAVATAVVDFFVGAVTAIGRFLFGSGGETPDDPVIGDPTAVLFDKSLHVFATARGSIVHIRQQRPDEGRGWTPWDTLGDPGAGGQSFAIGMDSDQNQRLLVYAIGKMGNLARRELTVGDKHALTWSPEWESLGTPPVEGVTLDTNITTIQTDASLDAFIYASDVNGRKLWRWHDVPR